MRSTNPTCTPLRYSRRAVLRHLSGNRRAERQTLQRGCCMSTILKWAGNKTAIMPELKKHLPAGPRLVEPFAGSCAVMMATDYPHYLVADINPDLINLYQVIKNDVDNSSNAKYFLKHNNAEMLLQYPSGLIMRHDLHGKRLYFFISIAMVIVGCAVITKAVILMSHTVIIKNRISLKMKYALLQKRHNAQRLSVPAMTKHWQCCKW
jgi:hypothetical protein